MVQDCTLSVSIVSHRQAGLVEQLLRDLERCTSLTLEVILTLNVPELLGFDVSTFSFPITVLTNRLPKGFGANHNAAFVRAGGTYFCILNPDIRIEKDPFPHLLEPLADATVGVVAPGVVNPHGALEDSARRFPTVWTLLKKAVMGNGGTDYSPARNAVRADWVAGMFLLFRSETFRRIGGFDEKYFLYYEDVDLCLRLRSAGLTVMWVPGVTIIHDARRESRRNLRYLSWHIGSALRYLFVSRRRIT